MRGLRKMDTKTIAPFVALGVAVVVGGVVQSFAPKPGKGKAKPKPPPESELEPWEIEAAAVGNVGDDIDEPDELPEDPVGSGSPEEHCLYDGRGVAILGAGEKDTEYFCVTDPLGDPGFAPQPRDAPMAKVPALSSWPLETMHRRRLVTSYLSGEGWRGDSGRSFGSSRGERNHAGIDLFGDDQDVVLAPEDGVVFRMYPFKDGTWAMYLWTHDDRILNLGEIEKGSWREFQIRPGDHVQRGQAVARIGLQDDGAHMLHFEIYDVAGMSEDQVEKQIRNSHYRWFKGDPRPNGLTDPSAYLVMAGTRTYRDEQSAANTK